MNEDSIEHKAWEEVIVDFFEHKVQKCKLFKAREYIGKKENEIENEKDEKKRQRAIKAKEKKQKVHEQLKKDAPSTEIRKWIDDTSKRKIEIGKRIIKATHVLKFTHSSSVSAGSLLKTKSNDPILTTSSLKKDLVIDLAHNNGNLITISRFLALKLQGKQIIDCILNDEFSFLQPFAGSESQYTRWIEGFKLLVEEREIKTADKAKQIYFPIPSLKSKKNNEYHIVIPLFSSSLADAVYSVVTPLKYGDEQKELNKTRKEQSPKFRKQVSVELPNLGMQKFGGEHPKNVSMLNANRSGKSYLFSAQPPTWQSQLKPPVAKFSFFGAELGYKVKETVDYLRDFLLRFQKIDLSIRDPKKKKWIEGWVNQIIDEVMLYAVSIQNLPPGWSRAKNNRLKPAHQYFLDPYRDDEKFQNVRQTTDWQAIICTDFASWLNGRLKDRKFTPQPDHTQIWKKLMEKELREHAQVIDWDIKEQKRENQS